MPVQPSPLQAGLFDPPGSALCPQFEAAVRTELSPGSWVEHLPGFVRGDAALFEHLAKTRPWSQRKRWMYEREVLEPRLTAPWSPQRGPLEPGILEQMRALLSRRYGVVFDSIGFNLYRDGQDSVAWHRDHISFEIPEPVVALVSLGHPRKLMMRPHGGGPSQSWLLGHGDLFVTGGRAQRDWDHCVPKAARVGGPRISLAFRYGLATNAYGGPARQARPPLI